MNRRLDVFFRRFSDRLFPNQEAIAFLIGSVVFIVGLYFFLDALFPILLSITFAFILHEPILWLVNKGVSRLVLALVVFILLFGLALVFFALFVPLVIEEGIAMIGLMSDLNRNAQQLIDQYLIDMPFFDTKDLRQFITVLIGQITASTQQILSFSFSSIVSVILGVLYCILIPILVFFFVYEGDSIYSNITSWFITDGSLVQTIWQQTLFNLGLYIRGKLIEVVIVSMASYLVLAVFSMKNALLLGVVTGVAVLIPYVGATLVAIPVVIVGLAQWGFDLTLLYVLFSYAIVQAIDAYVIVPWLFSSSLNLRPVTVLLAITFFGGIWGVWGVLVAIPLATFIKVVLSAWPNAIYRSDTNQDSRNSD